MFLGRLPLSTHDRVGDVGVVGRAHPELEPGGRRPREDMRDLVDHLHHEHRAVRVDDLMDVLEDRLGGA